MTIVLTSVSILRRGLLILAVDVGFWMWGYLRDRKAPGPETLAK